MAEIPQLAITLAEPDELVSALELIANTVAQQRQTLNRRVLSHPYFLMPAALILGGVSARTLNNTGGGILSGYPALVILGAGVLIALLSSVARYTCDYLIEAERIGSTATLNAELRAPDRAVVIARWGDKVIGAAVVRTGGERAEIWAWAVQLVYRGKGLGHDLLVKAVDVARERMGKDCDVVFAEDHARTFMGWCFVLRLLTFTDSYRIGNVPATFNVPFDRSEERARRALKKVLESGQ